jgi:8-oxo-dGTP pyrophosphatase MutT (NUDIX family)
MAAVLADQLTAQALRARFVAPPIWSPEVLAEKRFSDRKIAHASVLIPIIQREQPMVLLTERTHNMSTHSGQVAFPGGKADEEDEDAAATALREAHEEVGLEPQHVEVLGNLPTYVTGSAFIITPVVALVHPGFKLKPNPHEVADVFEVPLVFLMDPSRHQRHALEWESQRREWFSMPYRDAALPGEPERFIWGATAGILRNFYRFLIA